MRLSLLVWLSLATCLMLTTATCLVGDDPPFAQRSILPEPINLPHRISYDRLSALVQTSQFDTNSAASCASTACHGGPRPGVARAVVKRGAEYPLWLERDPHAQAYRSLSSELGTRILQRLNILDGAEITDRVAFNKCLACHNSTEQAPTRSTADFRQEGVACDRCHGPSQAWRSTHYTDQWPSIVASKPADAVGFVMTQDLLTRARMCASCHVGDSQRNMNHDMIAAGHPPLFYEFATYHNRLPKHWRDPRASDAAHYESTLWFVGQIAALEAQAGLIRSRAESSAATTAWPEFSHLDCASCHQPLTGESPVGQQSTGRAGWSHWQRWGIETILQNESVQHDQFNPSSASAELRSAIDQLDALLRSRTADRGEVKASAAMLQEALSHWQTAPNVQASLQKFSASQLKSLLNNASPTVPTGSPKPNWEALSQLYLAGVATRGQWPGAENKTTSSKSVTHSLASQLRRQLLFAPDKTVPHFQVAAATTQDAIAFLKALQQSSMQSTTTPSSNRPAP